MEIYCDRTLREAPVARDDNVQMLSKVEADVSHIPEHLLNRRQGSDGQWYYELSCKIEAVYLSASTTYTLLYNSMCDLIMFWKVANCLQINDIILLRANTCRV